MVDLRLFEYRNFAVGTVAVALGFGLYFAALVLIPCGCKPTWDTTRPGRIGHRPDGDFWNPSCASAGALGGRLRCTLACQHCLRRVGSGRVVEVYHDDRSRPRRARPDPPRAGRWHRVLSDSRRQSFLRRTAPGKSRRGLGSANRHSHDVRQLDRLASPDLLGSTGAISSNHLVDALGSGEARCSPFSTTCSHSA